MGSSLNSFCTSLLFLEFDELSTKEYYDARQIKWNGLHAGEHVREE